MRLIPTNLIPSLVMVFAIAVPVVEAVAGPPCELPPPCGVPHVVMIRGVAGYWPNADHLSEAIMANGMTTSMHHPLNAIKSADEIACYCRNNTPGQSVNVVAYSLGADAAIVLCEKLLELGIEVDCLILIETTFRKNQVPANVRYCFNLYEDRGVRDRFPAFRGVPVEACSPATVLQNTELGSTDLPARRISHFNIASREKTHEVVLEQLLSCNNCVR